MIIAVFALILIGPMLPMQYGYTKQPLSKWAYFASDGDSIKMINLRQPSDERSIRIYGIDAPEIRNAQCEAEKMAGYKARLRLQEMITGKPVRIIPVKQRDKYNRTLAFVFSGKENVADTLISEGLARKYFGGERQSWCG